MLKTYTSDCQCAERNGFGVQYGGKAGSGCKTDAGKHDKNPCPIRAEVVDMTDAVYDGTDDVILSGKTAKGKYPVESVTTMNDIIHSLEQFTLSRPDIRNSARFHSSLFTERRSEKAGSVFTAVTKAAIAAAEER